jgi:hypothetical protein
LRCRFTPGWATNLLRAKNERKLKPGEEIGARPTDPLPTKRKMMRAAATSRDQNRESSRPNVVCAQ